MTVLILHFPPSNLHLNPQLYSLSCCVCEGVMAVSSFCQRCASIPAFLWGLLFKDTEHFSRGSAERIGFISSVFECTEGWWISTKLLLCSSGLPACLLKLLFMLAPTCGPEVLCCQFVHASVCACIHRSIFVKLQFYPNRLQIIFSQPRKLVGRLFNLTGNAKVQKSKVTARTWAKQFWTLSPIWHTLQWRVW